VFFFSFRYLFSLETLWVFGEGGAKEEGHAGLVFNSFATRQGTLFVESVELMDSHMHACKLHTVSVALSACVVFVMMMMVMCC
jgi:nicotinamide mononucleotide (NMN) deamidase PncC